MEELDRRILSGYLYKGLVYYGGKPMIENGKAFWPLPMRRKTEPHWLINWEGKVKFKVYHSHVEIITEFLSIR